MAAFGRIDILINNAGASAFAPFDEYPDRYWEMCINLDLSAVYYMSQKVGLVMKANGGGKIVNMASIAATGAGRGPIVYTISKHAMLGLTRELAFFAGHMNINVNAILPGGVATEMIAEALNDETNPAVQLIKASPAERPAEPREIARVAVFLASDDASFPHGEGITADGGFTLL